MDELKVLCPFCNAEYTAKMLMELFGVDSGCDSCGDGAIADVKIEIVCDNCKRVVYIKEERIER